MLETSQISMLTTMDDIAVPDYGSNNNFFGNALTAEAARKYTMPSKPQMKNKKM